MSVLAPLSAVRASAKASTRSCEHTGPHAFAMTRSRNSRRGSSYSHWSSRFYTGSHTRPKTRDLWEDLHFDPWEQAEHADAEVEASGFAKYFGEEQLWTALSAVTATQLPSDPCSDDWESASDRWTLVSAAESSWVVEWETDGAQTAALLAPWPEEDVSDDAAIAAQLQDDERMSAGVGRFVIGRRTLGCRRPTRLPVDGLVARRRVFGELEPAGQHVCALPLPSWRAHPPAQPLVARPAWQREPGRQCAAGGRAGDHPLH